MQWKTCKQSVIDELDQLLNKNILCGYSCAFVDMNECDEYYGGVQGCIPPYHQIKIQKGMIYDLASLTKVVATTSRILQLMEEGKITENTLVCELLPQFSDKTTTIRDLLFHTSGLPSDLENKDQLNKNNIRDELFKVQTVNEKKGTVEYSDIGFAMLGFIIEKIDKSIEDSCHKHIFEPLKMTDTSYLLNAEDECYVPTEITIERGCVHKQVHDRKAFLLEQSGSAGLFSTLSDLGKFVKAFLEENEALFSQTTFQKLKQDRIGSRSWGWAKPYGEDVLYHTGFTGTSILIDMKRKKGMILLTNRIHPKRENEKYLVERERINKIFMETYYEKSTGK